VLAARGCVVTHHAAHISQEVVAGLPAQLTLGLVRGGDEVPSPVCVWRGGGGGEGRTRDEGQAVSTTQDTR
jgi:hypothetical protein